MSLRFFSPTLSYRLFDPMPLPKAKRKILQSASLQSKKKNTMFNLKIKKISFDSVENSLK